MKQNKVILSLVCFALVFALGGCGASEKEKTAAKERARLALEEKQLRETEEANKAITNMNQKMFGRMNSSVPGSATATTAPAQPPPSDQKKP